MAQSPDKVRPQGAQQALVLLNDPTYVEAARVWAGKLAAIPGDAARLRHAFRAATARDPETLELDSLRRTLERSRTHFAARPAEASKLLASGESPVAADLECATWAQLILKFIVSHPAVTTAIPATTRVDHVIENMGAATDPMPDAAQRAAIVAAIEAA